MQGIATASRALSMPFFDFPDWLNPILVKSLRQGLRSNVFVGVLLWTQISSALVVGCQALNLAANYTTVFLALNVFVLFAVVVPLHPIVLPDEDFRQECLDLLRMTPQGMDGIMRCKLLCLVIQAALLWISLLPYWLLRYFTGHLELGKEVEAFLWIAGSMIALAPWGLFVGSQSMGIRVFLSGLIFLALLFVFFGYVMILAREPRVSRLSSEYFAEYWIPWLFFALLVFVVGNALAIDRYDNRHYSFPANS